MRPHILHLSDQKSNEMHMYIITIKPQDVVTALFVHVITRNI